MFDDEPRPDPEIQEADPAARRRAMVIVVLTAVVGSLAVWLTERRLEELGATAEQDPERAVAAIVRMVRWLAVSISVLMAGFAVYGYRLAYQIGTSRRFPPPGMAVVRDTPVISGSAAVTRARLLALLMTLLVAASIALPIALVRVVDTLEAAAGRRESGGGGGKIALPPAPNIVKHKGEGALHEVKAARRNPKIQGGGGLAPSAMNIDSLQCVIITIAWGGMQA